MPSHASASAGTVPAPGRNGRAPARLLVAGDDFHASLALVRALAAAGHSPILAMTPTDAYAGRSRAIAAVVRVPFVDSSPAAFVEAVATTARRLAADAILPGTEASLIALSRARDSLPCPVGAPATEIVELATDKRRVLELAAQHGLDVPPSVAAAPAELAARADEFDYPAILKPPRTRIELGEGRLAHYNARQVNTAGELREVLRDLPPADWVVQPALPGKLSAVSGVAWEGSLLCAVHQVSHRIWPPNVGVSTYAETVEPDAEVEAKVASLLEAIGWSGLFQLQFIGDTGSGRRLIDFNPRAYGSLALAVRAGANLPANWAELVLGRAPAPPHYRPGVRYRLERNDARAILRGLRQGDVSGTLVALMPHRRTAHAIFSLRDPKPWLTKAREVLARHGHH